MRYCYIFILATLPISCRPEDNTKAEEFKRIKSKADVIAAGYNKVLTYAETNNNIIRDFNSRFNKVNNFISYYVEGNDPKWNSEAPLFNRYIISMDIPIVLSYDKKSILAYGSPNFQIVEVENIESNGAIRFSGKQLNFSIKEWHILLQHNMDFSVLGYGLIPDKPISHFEENWK